MPTAIRSGSLQLRTYVSLHMRLPIPCSNEKAYSFRAGLVPSEIHTSAPRMKQLS